MPQAIRSMAKNKDINIRINGKDNASGVFARINRSVKGLGKTLVSLPALAAGALGGISLAAGLRAAVSAGADFEQQMAKVLALTGATDAQFKQLNDTAKQLGATTQFSASQAAEAMTSFSLAGFSVDQTLAAMKPTLDLAAAGQLDMGTASAITAGVLRGMKLDVADLGDAVDVLAKAFTTSSTDLVQLGEAVKAVGPVGTAAGQSFQDLIATIQVFSNVMIQGGDAGTALRNILLRLQAQPSEVKKALDELNVSISDQDGRMRRLADIVDDLNVALAKKTDVERNATVAAIAGTRAAAAFTELLTQGGDTLREYSARLDASGTASRIAAIQMNTLTGRVTLLKSAAEGLGITIKESLDARLKASVEAITSLVGQIDVVVASVSGWTRANSGLIQSLATMSATAIGLSVILPRMAKGVLAVKGAVLLLADRVMLFNQSAKFMKIRTLAVAYAQVKARIATAALTVATTVLSAAVTGALYGGLSLLVAGFVRARVEGISFGEAILKIADDFGVLNSAAMRLKIANEQLADATAKATEARTELANAKTDQDRLAANQKLASALKEQIAARKKMKEAEAEGIRERLQAAEDALGRAEADSKTQKLWSDVESPINNLDRLRQRVDDIKKQLELNSAPDASMSSLSADLQRAQAAASKLAANMGGVRSASQAVGKDIRQNVLDVLDKAANKVTELARKMRDFISFDDAFADFTLAPLDAELRRIARQAENLIRDARISAAEGMLSEEQLERRIAAIRDASARKQSEARSQAASDAMQLPSLITGRMLTGITAAFRAGQQRNPNKGVEDRLEKGNRTGAQMLKRMEDMLAVLRAGRNPILGVGSI